MSEALSLTLGSTSQFFKTNSGQRTMSIQDIAVSHNVKKKLLQAVKNEAVLFQDEDGAVVVNVAAYLALKADKGTEPLESVLGDAVLDLSAEYIVFE